MEFGVNISALNAVYMRNMLLTPTHSSNKTALSTVFKLVEAAQKSRGRFPGYNQLPKSSKV